MSRAKPNVPLAGWFKIVFKKCGWEKNKKHRVGNECRFTRCPFVISFLCLWLPVKIVYFFLFLSLFCLSCRCLNTLAANGQSLLLCWYFIMSSPELLLIEKLMMKITTKADRIPSAGYGLIAI